MAGARATPPDNKNGLDLNSVASVLAMSLTSLSIWCPVTESHAKKYCAPCTKYFRYELPAEEPNQQQDLFQNVECRCFFQKRSYLIKTINGEVKEDYMHWG